MHYLDKILGIGEMKNYQITTVKKYVELLDKNLSKDEKKVQTAVEKYIHQAKKARTNAEYLEKILA